MSTTLDSLRLLEQTASLDKSISGRSRHSSKTSVADKEDYASVLARVEAEEAEWQKTLEQYDLAQYKISMMDNFWTGSTKHQDYIFKRFQRQQQQANQAAITDLLTNLMTLQRVQQYAAKNGTMDKEAANAIHQQLNTAVQNTFMLSLMNMNLGSSSLPLTARFNL